MQCIHLKILLSFKITSFRDTQLDSRSGNQRVCMLCAHSDKISTISDAHQTISSTGFGIIFVSLIGGKTAYRIYTINETYEKMTERNNHDHNNGMI